MIIFTLIVAIRRQRSFLPFTILREGAIEAFVVIFLVC